MERRREYSRNSGLETLLLELNELLQPVEESVCAKYRSPSWPVVLIVGCPRSGTTLALQWLASLGTFAYPTNLLARFYAAPYVGARIQQLLTDARFQFRDEFAELTEAHPDFESSLGKTRGVLAPNEFWYFWRRFFRFAERDYLLEDELTQVDGPRFTAELAAIEAAFAKPLCMKAMIINLNMEFIDRIMERVLFVHVHRRPFYNIQSLLDARIQHSGDVRNWYSFRPREFEELRNRSPYEQVAGQVYYLNAACDSALKRMSPSRTLSLSYEDLCNRPAVVYERLRARCAEQGLELPREYRGPERFSHADEVRLEPNAVRELVAAYARFAGAEIAP